MENVNATEKVIQSTFALPDDFSRPEKIVGGTDGITVINDTNRGATVWVHNEILGPASLGSVLPGRSVVLPCAWALWDVYALFDDQQAWFIRWVSVAKYILNPYTKSKGNVGYRDTVYLSKL